MRGRFLLTLTVALACASAVAPAGAQEPGGGHLPRVQRPLVDNAQVLDRAGQEVARAALDALAERGVKLLVLLDDNAQGMGGAAYTEAVARASELGAGHALLVVTVDDDTHGLWVSDSLRGVTAREVSALLAELRAPLAAGDVVGAIELAATGLAAALDEATPARPASADAPRLLALMLLPAALGGLWLWSRVRIRRARGKQG